MCNNLIFQSIPFIKQVFINSSNEFLDLAQFLEKTCKVVISKVGGFLTWALQFFLLTVSINCPVISVIFGHRPNRLLILIFNLFMKLNRRKSNLILIKLVLSLLVFFKKRQNGKGYFRYIIGEKIIVLQVTVIFTKSGGISFSRTFLHIPKDCTFFFFHKQLG